MTANYIYTESIETAWDALTDEQTAELEKVGLEGIGMETTEENIEKLTADDFRDILVG